MWRITIGHPAITTRFFVAKDSLGRDCLVDTADRALAFRLREEAEHYAGLHCTEHDWVLTRA